MIIIAGHLDYGDREARDAILAAGEALQHATLDGEPGCLTYSFTADQLVDSRVRVCEVWEDEPSLAAHFAHENYRQMREVFHLFPRTGGEVKKYRCNLAEPVYDDTGTLRADFFTAAE
ncbi:MAG TPA: antibiotic biosynthesis monooxygenase [Acidimicrobiales bacterium]|nr:antibiotic biosynthesis monooxygenase [Acidimicrobiales bacterium]